MEAVAKSRAAVSIKDIYEFCVHGVKLPDKAIAVTFDDGFADNHDVAAPLLNRLGIPAAFYVLVGSIGGQRSPWYCRLRYAFHTTRLKVWNDSVDNCIRPLETPGERKSAFLMVSRRCAQLTGEAQDSALVRVERELEVETLDPRKCPMMTWDQVRRLERMGHTVGPHSLTHPNMAYVKEEEVQKELRESKRLLEEQTGSPSPHFSYPSPILEPHYNDATTEWLGRLGFQTAVTCTPGAVRKGQNPLRLSRVSAPSAQDDFLWTLECSFAGLKV
jgi:peptidoglycan/xylan/chitin deacetylase (PgdA/CDA1 family)